MASPYQHRDDRTALSNQAWDQYMTALRVRLCDRRDPKFVEYRYCTGTLPFDLTQKAMNAIASCPPRLYLHEDYAKHALPTVMDQSARAVINQQHTYLEPSASFMWACYDILENLKD